VLLLFVIPRSYGVIGPIQKQLGTPGLGRSSSSSSSNISGCGGGGHKRTIVVKWWS